MQYFNSGVNFDYLVAIKPNKKGLLQKIHYCIDYYQDLKTDLLKMLDDSTYDVFDMNREYGRIPDDESYNQCIGFDYYDSYISAVTSPEFDENKVKQIIEEKEHSVVLAKKRLLKKSFPEWSAGKINKEARKRTVKVLIPFHHNLKDSFLRKRTRYIEAAAYDQAYNDIKDSVVFLSSERHGWRMEKGKSLPSWEYKINEDLHIALWSNFCYGSSSRFLIQVFYKGIRLCPYSEFVTYRYANTTDILNYTRKFIVRRACWEDAADFVVRFCNGAIKDSERFVKKEILYEITTLVEELSKIAASKELYLKGRFEGQGLFTNRYSGVSNVEEFSEMELKKYTDDPSEYELLYRMEKISGALSFLESISQFSYLSSTVLKAIETIQRLNIEIYPELISSLPPLNREVEKLHDKLDRQRQKTEVIGANLDKHYTRIERVTNRYKSSEEINKYEEAYRKRHPELEELEKQFSKEKKELRDQERIYKGRKNYLDKLKKCRQDVEDSGVLTSNR